MKSQSPLKKSIKESGLCVGPVKHLLISASAGVGICLTNLAKDQIFL